MVNQLKSALERHGFGAKVFDTATEAVEYLCGEIKAQTVGLGGSETLKQLGLELALQSAGNIVVSHNAVNTMDVRRLANQAKVYITSANAVAMSGEIVNIDGRGNRVAMTSFGPESCYYVIGENKITQDLPTALFRAKNIAAPLNARRLQVKTPCAQKGDKCYDCNSPQRICRITTVIDRAPIGMKCEVIIIKTALGF